MVNNGARSEGTQNKKWRGGGRLNPKSGQSSERLTVDMRVTGNKLNWQKLIKKQNKRPES